MSVASLSQRIVKKRLKKLKRPNSLRKFSLKTRRKARIGYRRIHKSVPRSNSGPQTKSEMLAQIETLEAQIQDAERELVIVRRECQKLNRENKKLKVQLQHEDEVLATILKEKDELEMKLRNQVQASQELEEVIEALQEVVGRRILAQEVEAEKEEWKKKYTDTLEFAREFVNLFEKAEGAIRADSSLCLPTEVSEFMEYCGTFAEALRKHLETSGEV